MKKVFKILVLPILFLALCLVMSFHLEFYVVPLILFVYVMASNWAYRVDLRKSQNRINHSLNVNENLTNVIKNLRARVWSGQYGNLESVLEDAHDSEIRVKIETSVKGKIKVTIYRQHHGHSRVSSYLKYHEIENYIHSNIMKLFPDSDYAKNYQK